MDTSQHNLTTLFAQLGLPNKEQDIEVFIKNNKGIEDNTKLENAKFWNSSQAQFISQAFNEDADWSEIVDTLDAMLR